MSIYYTLIANKKDNVICEYTEKTGNFQQVSRRLLSLAVENETNQAMEYKNYKFHSINENGLTFLSLSEGISNEIMIAFLKDVQCRLTSQYDWEYITSASAYKLSAFESQLKELIDYYESNPIQSITGDLIKNLSQAKSLVVKNIESLMDRENTLEITIKNSDKLKESSHSTLNFVSKINVFNLFYFIVFSLIKNRVLK